MKKRLVQSLTLVAAFFLLAGCAGYQLGAVKPSAYSGINRIHVPTFKNLTQEPRISAMVTNAVIKEMQTDGTYQISNRQTADAVLVGSIERIRKHQLRGERTDTIRSRELGLYLYVRWRLEDPNTGEAVVTIESGSEADEEEAIQMGNETIRISPGVVVGNTVQNVDQSFQVGERNAVAVAAEDAAKKLVDQLSEGW